MTATTRQFISALLSLLLVISGPALAMSKIADSDADTAMPDCGSMMMAQAESAGSSTDTEADCASAPDMACPSGFTDTGSHPVLTARSTFYQDPFLASITPPPEHHS